jgi:hypothetical protein
MCNVQLRPGVNPIAVNKYHIISHHFVYHIQDTNVILENAPHREELYMTVENASRNAQVVQKFMSHIKIRGAGWLTLRHSFSY